jgi:cytochrome c553
VYKVVEAHTSVSNWYPDSVWYFEVYEEDSNDTGREDNNQTSGGDDNETDGGIDDINSSQRLAVGYLPTWLLEGFHTVDYASSQIATIDNLYTHVVISFAKPDMTFNGTNFVGTGVEFASYLDGVKKAIEVLQKRGVKVLLAVGGATYNNWDPLANEQGVEISSTTHKKALKAFMDALNLDGIDVDYEVTGADSANVARYYKSILALKEVVGDKLLTMAGWSTGADCTAGTSEHLDCQGKVSYWGNSAGRERLLFKKFRDDGYNVEELFDYVAIMTYDGGLSRFDPITLFKNYQAIYAGPLAMGFEIPAEAWGGAELVVTNAQAEACESTSMISGDSYSTSATKKHYSIERLVNFVNSVPNSGIMLWSLYEAKHGANCASAVDYNSFTVAMKNYLAEKSDSNETNSSSGDDSSQVGSKYHDVLGLSLKFYEAQRDVGPFSTVEWRKPASINDGADVGLDLNGGWFDAGDHVKFNLPMSYSVGMLNWSLIDQEEAYRQAGKLTYGKEQVKYALDYLLETYQAGANLDSPDDDMIHFQVADGHADHGFWGAPETLNMNRPTFTCDANGGCAAVAGSMVGAFASGAILFKEDTAYATQLLESAKRLYKFAMKYQTDTDYSSVGQDFYALYQNGNNEDQLAWAGVWLYKATNDVQYLNDAKAIMEGIYPWSGHSWDNLGLGVFTLLAEETNDAGYRTLVENELNKWVNKDVPTSTGGLRVLQKWGSLRYASTASYIALAYSDQLTAGAKKDSYITFAKSQIDYILGDNPNNFSYVVGYGDNYPLRPHHRAASGTTETDSAANKYVIEGALVGGPLSADDNSYQDIRYGEVGYTANEVATDYNAGFTGALAKLALLYGEESNTTDTEDDNGNSDDDDTSENPSDAELVAAAKEALNFNSIKNTNTLATEIKNNLSLITLGQGDVSIRWSSSANGISPQGVVTRGSNNAQVTLTATLSHGNVSDTKVFTVVVLKEVVEGGACQVTYGVRDAWDAGFVVDFSLVNQLNNVYGWEVTFTLPEGQRVDSLWNGRRTADTGFIKVTNEDYNAQVNKGSKLEFGFVINHGSGQAGEPTDIRFNGQLCDGQVGGVEKPAQPTNLEAELINNSKVTLTWDDNSANEENFLVYQSKDLGSWELLVLLDANTSSYENIEVEVEHSYQFKVEAKNIAGTSTSETVTVTPILITVQSGVSNKAISLVNNCMSCHTETNSHPSIPIIHGLSRDYLEKTLKGYRTSDTNSEHFSFAMHRVMDGYTDDEMELMIDYFAAQPWVGNEVVSYDIESLNLGKTLFESNCVICHGDDAKKDGIILSGQSEAYLVDTMTNYAKGLHKDAHDGMKFVFESNIGVDEAKIEALAKYLAVGMEVPDGTNDTIRGFKAKYLSSSNSIEVSWDYINPDASAVEVMVDDTVVKRLNAVTGSSVTIENNGTDSFVIGNHYEVQLKAIFSDTEVTSSTILVEIKTDLAYGEEHYKSNCKVCHGVNGTARADLTAWNPSEHSFTDFTRNSTMDPSFYSNCDDECLELIGTYVREVLEPRVRENNTTSVEDVYSDLPRGYRLLNNMEYTNTLYSLFEIESNAERSTTLALEYTDLPKDNIVEGYNTNRDMNRIDEDKLKALNAMAKRVQEYLESLKGQNSNACLINGYDFCIADVDDFLDTFAVKIFRRPLSLGEENKYRAVGSVGKIVEEMLVSPKFLYRSEMGELTEESGVYALTQYEIATAIAYSMAGTTPDDELLSLAASGALSQPNTRVTQAVRLLDLQTGKDKLDDFIGRWLLEDNIFSLSDKNPERFAGYNEAVRTAQSQEVLKYFRMVMESNSKSSYKDLFINDDMMRNKVLSDFYGEGSSSTNDFEKVSVSSTRHGILTLGAIASKYANSEESHPFKRGTFVLKRLMCHDMGLPGNGGDIPAIVDHAGKNKRDRYAEHVNDPSCATCHNLIDPIGFTWENYDGSGRYRTAEYHSAENGGPKTIDASVTLRGLLTFDESETHPSNGIYDVSQLIAESDRGPSCMALQYYRYISGDAEASLENSHVVKKIASDFKDEQYDLQSLFTNMVKLNSFVTRRGE